MTWLTRLGWGALAFATLAGAASVYLVELPQPAGTIVIDKVTYVAEGQQRPVALPHTDARRTAEQGGSVRYLAGFELTAIPHEPLFLFIPAVNRELSLTFNGRPLFYSDVPALWAGPLVRRSGLVQLPQSELKVGRNELSVTMNAGRTEIPSYLSKLFIGGEGALTPIYNLRLFLEDRLKTMAAAAQLLLGIGIFFGYFYRPKDPLFAWLAATVAVTLVLSTGFFGDVNIGIVDLRVLVTALSPVIGFLFIGIALALVRIPMPRALRIATWVVPALTVLPALLGLNRPLVLAIGLALLVAGLIAATAVVAWGAFKRSGTEARLMLAPFFLFTWFTMRDSAVATGLIDGSLFVAPYARPLFLACVTAVLMRRLAMSLDDLDRSNETLNRRLAEREAELALLHREERIEAARLVREQERQRLTRDLHDGISGHLVSIIAMTERAGGDVEPIEQAARRALEDLRLVIYSLDLGDRDLALALANFRERLIPQLQRIGVELDWTIADLPEVSGVTPGNALSILRILQEAITNALKHGPARKITIRGAAAGDRVAITVDNDGRPFVADKSGHGLANMRRRAQSLNGELQIMPLAHGARLTLLLPVRLPDVLDASA